MGVNFGIKKLQEASARMMGHGKELERAVPHKDRVDKKNPLHKSNAKADGPALLPSLLPCGAGQNVELEAFLVLRPNHAGSDATTCAEIVVKKTGVASDAAELEEALQSE